MTHYVNSNGESKWAFKMTLNEISKEFIQLFGRGTDGAFVGK